MIPFYSLMIATEPHRPRHLLDEIGLRDGETFNDLRHLVIYGQRTADGRIAFGGRGAPYHFGSRIEPGFDRDRRMHSLIRETLVELFPALAGTRITHRWGGPLGIARDWHPSVGFDRATGMGWAGGYVGDGVAVDEPRRPHAGRARRRARRTTARGLCWVGHRSRAVGARAASLDRASTPACRRWRTADRAEQRSGRALAARATR